MDLRYLARKARFVPPADLAYYASRYLMNRVHRLASPESRLSSWGPRFAGMGEMLEESPLLDVCVEQWKRSVLKAATALERSNRTAVLEIHYEELVNSPQHELRRVIEFIAPMTVNDQLDVLSKCVQKSSIGKWRSAREADAIAKIEPTVRDVFATLASLRGGRADVAA